ncbi:DNA ligase 3 [Bulinus truncatus]|nr:DNA ligase 3 [Bulinus truncatus]
MRHFNLFSCFCTDIKDHSLSTISPVTVKYFSFVSSIFGYIRRKNINFINKCSHLKVEKSSYCGSGQFTSFNHTMGDNKFIIGYAKLGTSSCKKCKQKIDKESLRIGKVTPNPFSDDGGDMKQWYHPGCLFETFIRARATTKKIEDPEDVIGFHDLKEEDKQLVKKLIDDFQTSPGRTSNAKKATSTVTKTPIKTDGTSHTSSSHLPSLSAEKDNSLRQFRRLCADIADENSYLGKTKLVNEFITNGSNGDGYHGDIYLLMKLLLPGVVKTVYNLNNKQLVKLFSQIFATSLPKMVEDLEKGDVAETIRIYFEESKILSPLKKSDLSISEVDQYLNELSQASREDDQQRILTNVAKKCTANDLKMFVRLIKHDLRINAGAKHILDGLHPNAYAAFQASHNLEDVIHRVCQTKVHGQGKPGMNAKLSIGASLMTPVLPMLAEACRSVEQAFKKCPSGFYAEIKYDGERVQLHKKGNEFKYYSRSLKPVLAHKVLHFKDFIPKAFPSSNDLILDCEVLLVDNKSGNPLPFGSLNVHKKASFQDATVCLFVFDCLLINEENLMGKPVKIRRKILEENMSPVKNHVQLSETKLITVQSDLQELMAKVFKEGLEGLVLKDINGIYEPGKRHWLKVKKDYLNEGSMADSADLVVLGAYFGTGNKGGMMSIFLMGVFDPEKNRWTTVTKCGIGFDDKKLEELNKELDMVKISKDMTLVPNWLYLNKPLCPDFVVKDPKKSPVWEIIGAEFSKAEIHTADGISIRFPRVQRFRDDKTWKEATDLPRLKKLFEESKKKTDLNLMKALGKAGGSNDSNESNSDTEQDCDRATTSITKDSMNKYGQKRHLDSSEDVSSKTKMKLFEETKKKTDLNLMKALGKAGGSNDSNESNSDTEQDCDRATTSITKDSMNKYGQKRHLDSSEEDVSSKTKMSKFFNKQGTESSIQNLQKETSGSELNSQLVDIFHGCRIMLPPETPDFKRLKRYILAFDGDLVHEFDTDLATHIIAPAKISPSTSKAPAMISSDWLWSCIKQKKLVSVETFRVTKNSS